MTVVWYIESLGMENEGSMALDSCMDAGCEVWLSRMIVAFTFLPMGTMQHA